MQREIIADTVGSRRKVATYASYAEAQAAVDYLADHKFPVERVAIVAEGLRLVEQVTGRVSLGSALLSGTLSGAATGALIGFIFGLLSIIQPLVSAFSLAFYGLLFGAIVGALMALLAQAFSGGRRDFSSVSGLQATRYDVMVDEDFATEAARLLVRFGEGAAHGK